ncbi:hypothetical protein V6N13_107936 [Hibiscus sabdariffa]
MGLFKVSGRGKRANPNPTPNGFLASPSASYDVVSPTRSWALFSTSLRLQGCEFMGFQSVKRQLSELYRYRRLNLPIWSVIKCNQLAYKMNISKYIFAIVLP